MTTGPAVRVRGLRVVRGGHIVLPDIDLAVSSGVVTGLLGPSGCGKSTLMRAIVGVQVVAAGEVTVHGLPAGTPELRHQVGYVTQAPSVYSDLTVLENVRYYAAVLGAPSSDVDRVIDDVGLKDFVGRLAGDLSGGQRSRVSLATALLGSPRLLVLDEPTVGLDPVLRHELWGTFHELADAGVTLLVSSHVMDEAERCDELILMRDGEVIAAEAPDALIARTGAKDVESAFMRIVDPDGEWE